MSQENSVPKSEARADRLAKRSRRSRRSVVVAVAFLTVIVGVSEWLAPSDTSSSDASGGGKRAQAVVDPQETRSTWFCAGGTSQPGGIADETLTVANVGGSRSFVADIKVSVMTGVGVATGRLDFTLAPRGGPLPSATGLPSVRSIPVSSILANPDPGVVVEAIGAPVVVTHSVSGAGDVGATPCARGGSDTWYFAGGTTVLGAEQWLTLFNPFPGDAVVDLTFFTNTGVEEPGDAQGVVVAGTSRLSIPIHDLVPRRDSVATRVTTRRGRVIAEQVQILDGRDGRKGITLVAGVPELAKKWWFSGSTAQEGRSTNLSILNPGATKVNVRIDTALVGAVTLAPIDVEIPPRSVAVTDVSSRVPVGTPFAWSLSIRGSGDSQDESIEGISASALIAQTGIELGVAADSGSSFASSSWYSLSPDLLGGATREIAIFNASDKRVTWRVQAFAALPDSKVQRGTLAPGGLSRQTLTSSGVTQVVADGLVTISEATQGPRGLILSGGFPVCPSPLVGSTSGGPRC
ncbi:MAG: hypothetical protein F2723_02265 [Actinobacteria bacterium]|uniref:Unannotated protein n=1 Tax=freshwater metagenome TaxID=449393 RepID=A0A6J6VN06_9ZZZZ|nr:hypothetical protein [Actinomycetota bacterium]